MMIKKATIIHLNILKISILTGIILCIIGLITSIADAIFNGVIRGILAPATSFLFPATGIWGIFMLPVLGFAAGFLIGALIATLFNLAGKLTGGLDIEIAETREKHNQ